MQKVTSYSLFALANVCVFTYILRNRACEYTDTGVEIIFKLRKQFAFRIIKKQWNNGIMPA